MAVTKIELLARLDQGLRDMALGDVKRASQPGNDQGGAKMAGFLLGFCFIDAMAGFHAGRTKGMKRVIGKHFISFVKTYMPHYDAKALYHDLRSGLVHSYSIGNTYVFTDREQAGKHLDTTQTGFGRRTLLNLEEFVDDLEQAYQALRHDIEANPAQFAKAKARLESSGLMTVK